MKIRVTAGHLTQTEKVHIKALFNAGLMEGKVNRKTYHMTKNGETYTVKVSQMEKTWIGQLKPKLVISTQKFQIV